LIMIWLLMERHTLVSAPIQCLISLTS